MAKTKRIPWGPRDYILYGVLAAVLGGLAAAIIATGGDADTGLLALSIVGLVAGIWVLIGVIGLGVVVGMREHRNERILERAAAKGEESTSD